MEVLLSPVAQPLLSLSSVVRGEQPPCTDAVAASRLSRFSVYQPMGRAGVILSSGRLILVLSVLVKYVLPPWGKNEFPRLAGPGDACRSSWHARGCFVSAPAL